MEIERERNFEEVYAFGDREHPDAKLVEQELEKKGVKLVWDWKKANPSSVVLFFVGPLIDDGWNWPLEAQIANARMHYIIPCILAGGKMPAQPPIHATWFNGNKETALAELIKRMSKYVFCLDPRFAKKN